MEFPVQEVHRPAIRIEPIEMMPKCGEYLKRSEFSWIFPWREKNFIDEKGQAFFLNFREIILSISPEPLSPPFSEAWIVAHPFQTAKRNTGIPASARGEVVLRCLERARALLN
jgi:hypothetical protein